MSITEAHEAFDQAAGLRAMLKQTPPEVLAVLPCGAAAMHWVAAQAQLRAVLGLRVLAFDEWQLTGNFSDCMGVAPRFDLQQAVEGQVPLEHCIAEVPVQSRERAPMQQASLSVLSVARLAREIEGSRILQQRTSACLQRLQTDSDEWLLVARPCEFAGLSSFARAAPRLLLVVEPVERAITEAYSALKRLAQGADTLAVGITIASPDCAKAQLWATRFTRTAAAQLGIQVQGVMSIGEALGLAGGVHAEMAGFSERLLARAGGMSASKPRRDRQMA